MNAKLLIASVAIVALAVGGASANTHKKHSASTSGAYAAPAQPIPYAQFDTYMSASPDERRAILASADTTDMAATGSPADVSATEPSSDSMESPASESAMPAPPPRDLTRLRHNYGQSPSTIPGTVSPPLVGAAATAPNGNSEEIPPR
jgi:hypothetical protein